MAQASSVQDTERRQTVSSIVSPVIRNQDPLAAALRRRSDLNLQDLIRLNKETQTQHYAFSSGVTSDDTVFTSHQTSTYTKPTSSDETQAKERAEGSGPRAGKEGISYASSLSVAHGSGSEAEERHHVARRDALLAVGDWTSNVEAFERPLKSTVRAKTRTTSKPKSKHKKPIVEIHQHPDDARRIGSGIAMNNHVEDVVLTATGSNGPERHYLHRQCAGHNEEFHLSLAEEGNYRLNKTTTHLPVPLTSVRKYFIISIVLILFITLTAACICAVHTGKERLSQTKKIVFGATVLVASFTVLAMIIARRVAQEAFLAGLFEIVIGFTLLRELDGFL